MAAISGISVSEELAQVFSAATENKNIRFIKVDIQNESLTPVTSVEVSGSLDEDLALLQDHLDEDVPCYILARMDDPPTEWLAISYVPDSAHVRQKMLYAATRSALTKSLGSVLTDSLFATSKADVCPGAYASHKRQQAAPKPMSAREREIEAVKAAEREAGASYEGSRARQNHLGSREVGYVWVEGAKEAVAALRAEEGNHLVVLRINEMEQIALGDSVSIGPDVGALADNIPPSEPSYCLFAWQDASPNGRDIVFIYSCPSNSPVKSRMVYSTGALVIFREVKAILGEERGFVLASRKIETSDPKALTEAFLREELSAGNGMSDGSGVALVRPAVSNNSFARPKGPGRRR